jgi:voltage-dependent calcium channel T type alpha-1H
MQFFAARFHFDPDTREYVPWDPLAFTPDHPPWSTTTPYENSRSNFDTLGHSILTVFQILTGEDWHMVMYDAIRATGYASVVYFVLLFALGRLVVLNLFLAMLASNFDKAQADQDEHEEEDIKKTKQDPQKQQDEMVDYQNGPIYRLRQHARKIVAHPYFDRIILALIFISSLALAMDSPLDDPVSFQVIALITLDNVLTVLFTIEMLLKLAALGVGKYCNDSWNILDGLIVILSLVSIAAKGSSFLQSFKSLRALRALRPLRVINRAPGLKLAVNSLLGAIPSAINVFVVAGLFFLVFAILGTDMFKGKMHSCNFDALSLDEISYIRNEFGLIPHLGGGAFLRLNESHTLFTISNCTQLPGSWESAAWNFDHVGEALISLFIMSTTESWMDIMRQGMDATGVGQQPVQDESEEAAWFFVGFMLVCSFMVSEHK